MTTEGMTPEMRAVVQVHQRQAIRNGTPGTALGRIWQKHAVAVLDALETAEAERDTQALQRDDWQSRAMEAEYERDQARAELATAQATLADCRDHHEKPCNCWVRLIPATTDEVVKQDVGELTTDHVPGCDIGPSHTGNCSSPLVEEVEVVAEVVDLVAALRKSVEAAKKRREESRDDR